ncbi:MAG: TonB C-terminal domain-containing protein [Candidatus Adiutrix sp.]|nr:TonB C-terminal domain-containing protein [Candidatus Adiutrix sp.]
MPSQRVSPDNVIYVQLGSTMPQASAAPKDLPVAPNQDKPDVQKAPKSDPTPPAQPDPVVDNPPVTAPPDDAISIGKTPVEPPKIQRTPEKPPQVKPPKVEPKEDPAEIKRKRDEARKKREAEQRQKDDAKLKQALEELERIQAAKAQAVDDLDAKMWDMDRESGSGDGAGSEPSSTMRGERVHPEIQQYYNHIRDIVKYNWIPDNSPENIAAQYAITIQPSGALSASIQVQSSGSEKFDDSVERAVKISTFPQLPPIFNNQAHTVTLEFTPKGLRSR